MTRIYSLLICMLLTATVIAQADTTQWVRAFPITNYITKLNDSIAVVQVYLPGGPVLKDRQAGMLRGIYNDNHADTAIVGSGRCHLIKGDYYYFSIKAYVNNRQPKENDLLYTFVQRPAASVTILQRIAAHWIELQNVYEESFYDRSNIFNEWNESIELVTMDSIARDTRFTGDYFTKNDTSQNKLISKGRYKGKKIFSVMSACNAEDIKLFLNYMIARPRLYAGRQWKASELFATWVSEGAPEVVVSR
jgi:hypothetical protein